MKGSESEQPVQIGWLQFFFEEYLPESPCPPGCRHRHSGRLKVPGSLSSGSPFSSCVGETEDFFADTSSAYNSEDTSPYHKFSPIPMSLEPPPQSTSKISLPYSDRSTTSSLSPAPGYLDDMMFRDNLSTSDEELRQIDDLISIYSEKLSESESVSSRKSSRCTKESPEMPRRFAPLKQTFSFSDSEIQYYQSPDNNQEGEVADCVLSKCHCMISNRNQEDLLMERSPLQNMTKLSRDISTQCIFSDMVELEEVPSPRVWKHSSTDDDTLTKKVARSPSPDTIQQRSYLSDMEHLSEDESPDLPYHPDTLVLDKAPGKIGLHVELSLSSSGGKTTSSDLTTPGTTASSAITSVSSVTVSSTVVTTSSADSLTTVSPFKQSTLQELAAFPPFVIDFFQFAAHPEDYLTDEQLEWYYEVNIYQLF